MATSRGTWKSRERKVAADFGTKRTPLSGINSGHNTHSDSLHDKIYIECKLRKKHTCLTLYRDTKEKADAEHKTPLVALMEKGKQGYWLLLHVDDIQTIASELKRVREQADALAKQQQPVMTEEQCIAFEKELIEECNRTYLHYYLKIDADGIVSSAYVTDKDNDKQDGYTEVSKNEYIKAYDKLMQQ